MGFRAWLKKRLLPFEDPTHPLFFDRKAEEEREAAKQKEDEESLRFILGDEFVDRLNNF
jgi:hypothetical protein